MCLLSVLSLVPAKRTGTEESCDLPKRLKGTPYKLGKPVFQQVQLAFNPQEVLRNLACLTVDPNAEPRISNSEEKSKKVKR